MYVEARWSNLRAQSSSAVKTAAISQEKLTMTGSDPDCPAERLLRSVSGKWKPNIIVLATQGPVRFSQLLRALPGSTLNE